MDTLGTYPRHVTWTYQIFSGTMKRINVSVVKTKGKDGRCQNHLIPHYIRPKQPSKQENNNNLMRMATATRCSRTHLSYDNAMPQLQRFDAWKLHSASVSGDGLHHRIVSCFVHVMVRVGANVPCAMCERCPKLILYLYLIVHVTGYLAWDKISLINSSTVYLHAPNDRDMGFTCVPLIWYNIVGDEVERHIEWFGHRRSADECRWIKVGSMSITFHRVHTIG